MGEPSNPKKTKHDHASKFPRREYEGELLRLQGELVKLKEWVRYNGLRVLVVFEGRDAAGKGGAIKRITEYLNPRLSAYRGAARTDRAREDAVVLPALRRRTYPPRARSCSSTEAGTTAPGSST